MKKIVTILTSLTVLSTGHLIACDNVRDLPREKGGSPAQRQKTAKQERKQLLQEFPASERSQLRKDFERAHSQYEDFQKKAQEIIKTIQANGPQAIQLLETHHSISIEKKGTSLYHVKLEVNPGLCVELGVINSENPSIANAIKRANSVAILKHLKKGEFQVTVDDIPIGKIKPQ
ncbi:MAG: hypothetical protein RLZ12_258, partial [Bacillota bacterium]